MRRRGNPTSCRPRPCGLPRSVQGEAAPASAAASAETRERLRALGYIGTAPPLRPAGRAGINPAAQIATWVAFEDALDQINAGSARDALAPLAALHAANPGAQADRGDVCERPVRRRAGTARPWRSTATPSGRGPATACSFTISPSPPSAPGFATKRCEPSRRRSRSIRRTAPRTTAWACCSSTANRIDDARAGVRARGGRRSRQAPSTSPTSATPDARRATGPGPRPHTARRWRLILARPMR